MPTIPTRCTSGRERAAQVLRTYTDDDGVWHAEVTSGTGHAKAAQTSIRAEMRLRGLAHSEYIPAVRGIPQADGTYDYRVW